MKEKTSTYKELLFLARYLLFFFSFRNCQQLKKNKEKYFFSMFEFIANLNHLPNYIWFKTKNNFPPFYGQRSNKLM